MKIGNVEVSDLEIKYNKEFYYVENGKKVIRSLPDIIAAALRHAIKLTDEGKKLIREKITDDPYLGHLINAKELR